MYGQEVSGKVKYYNAGMFVIMATIYWTFFRVFALYFLMHIDFVFWESFPYVGIVLLLSYLFWIGPLQKKERAQHRASGLDFYDSLIQKGKKRPQSLMLGFDDVYELDMNFDNDDSLMGRLNSQWYLHYLQIIVQQQIETYEEKYMEPPMELSTVLDNLKGAIKQPGNASTEEEKSLPEQETIIEDTTNPPNQTNINLPAETPTSKDNKTAIAREILIKETQDLEQQVRDIIPAKITKILPFEKFDIVKTRKEADFIKGIKYLKTLGFYYIKMYTKESFEGETEEWEDLIIVIPGKYSTTLKTHKEESELDDWPVNIKMCFCFWTYWRWVIKGMPILYLNFSDNMVKPELAFLTEMNAKLMAYLELKVMDLWMNDLLVRPELIIKENVYLTTKAKTYEDGFSDLIQDQADMDIKYSEFLENKAQNMLIRKIEKYKHSIIVLLSVIVILFIVGGISISFLI